MEMLTFRGIVLREYPLRENDKFIHVFTKEYGVIEISVRGGRKMVSNSAGGTQLFAYSDFSVRSDRGRCYLDSCKIIHLFYELREDIKRLSLAEYIAEVVTYAAGNNEQKEEVMRLILNTFHYLATGERSCVMLKSIFEMRFMTEIGMMPDIVCCPVCMAYTAEYMCFDSLSTKLYCGHCFKGKHDDTLFRISEGTVKALRHIVFADFDRLFNFRLEEKCMKKLSQLTEKYLVVHLGRGFKTLDFYRSIVDRSKFDKGI